MACPAVDGGGPHVNAQNVQQSEKKSAPPIRASEAIRLEPETTLVFSTRDRGIAIALRVPKSRFRKGFSLAMAAWQPGMYIYVFDGNRALGLPNHLAVVNRFDLDTVVCVMDATYITEPNGRSADSFIFRAVHR